MHLYGDILESYATRELPVETLAAIDVHVSNCLFCAHALGETGSVSARWERRGWLGRLVRVEDPIVADDYVEESGERVAA